MKASRRKAKVRGTFVQHVRVDKLLALYHGCCGICGEKVNPERFTIDHIVPASRGGTHCYENCQPAHPYCNNRKGDLLPEEMDAFWPVRNERRKSRYRNGMVYRKRIPQASARAA